jgi:putative glutamine amidotransferase
MQPVVGISLCTDARGRWREGRTYHYLSAAYAEAVAGAGAVPLYLPSPTDHARLRLAARAEALADAKAALARVDALVIPGGDDFLPDRPYPDSVRFEPVPDAQLRFDLALLRAARARRLPVLGVCYGMQVMAVEDGGALIYDIATDCPGLAEHQLRPNGRHDVYVDPGSRLARIVGERVRVNSRHHQAVSGPGETLRACAHAPDGLIEAIESADESAPFCVGVQWHAEDLEGEAGAGLFRALVEAARAR